MLNFKYSIEPFMRGERHLTAPIKEPIPSFPALLTASFLRLQSTNDRHVRSATILDGSTTSQRFGDARPGAAETEAYRNAGGRGCGTTDGA